MIKLNVLAAIIPALLVIGASNAAEIYTKNSNKLDFYGKFTGEHSFTTSGTHKNADASYSKVGLKGETQVNDQIIGYGQWEFISKAGKAESEQDNATRLAFAGIKINDAGSIDYGRNYGIIHDVESYVDMVPPFRGKKYGASYTDNYMTSRSTGLLTYRNSNFFGLIDGLNFGIQYQSKNDRSNLKQANGDGVGVSLGYDFGEGLGLTGAYSTANRTIIQKADGKGDKAEYWAIGAKYNKDNIYLASVYTESRNISILANSGNTLVPDFDGNTYNVANKTLNLKMIAQYQFDFGLCPSISYVQSKGKDLNSIGSGSKHDRDLAKYITTGAAYYLNKNFNVYGNYSLDLLNNSSNEENDTSLYSNNDTGGHIHSDSQATVGVTYQF